MKRFKFEIAASILKNTCFSALPRNDWVFQISWGSLRGRLYSVVDYF